MCGIGGIVGDGGGLDAGALLRSLAHRGPDQQRGDRVAPGVFLVATRLAIRDLSAAGDQPMTTEDGALTVVHNGEIDNATSLRRDLEARGHRFRSRCDTEVLLHAYREHGEEFVARLDGMFAFALWDRDRRRLLLGRDALGIKPLYFVRDARRVVFASEVRALLAAGAADRSLCREGVAGFLRSGSAAEPGAILRGVEALPPGHHLWLSPDALDAAPVRYWSLPASGAASGLADRSPADAAALVRELLDASVARSLEADVPVAVLLSGGIDSAVLATLARARSSALTAFHVRVSDGGARRARTLAAVLGLPYRELSAAAGARDLDDTLAAQDQPSVDGANTFLVARALRDAGCKVALTGLGGDELFLGYPLHRSFVRASAVQSGLAHFRDDRIFAPSFARGQGLLSRLAGRVATAGRGSWKLEKLLTAMATRGGDDTYRSLRALFPASTVSLLLPERSPARSGAEPDGRSGARRETQDAARLDAERTAPWRSDPAGEISRLDLRHYLVDTLLRDADVMSMAHGVELRVPLLDRRLVETVMGISSSVKLRPRRKKPLLVDAVPELPAFVEAAEKEGFELPIDAWLLGPLRGAVEESLCSSRAAVRVGMDARSVSRVWQRFVARPSPASAHRVWALHALLRYAERHRLSA